MEDKKDEKKDEKEEKKEEKKDDKVRPSVLYTACCQTISRRF